MPVKSVSVKSGAASPGSNAGAAPVSSSPSTQAATALIDPLVVG